MLVFFAGIYNKIFQSVLLKNLLIYSFGGIILRAIPFIFTPFTLNVLYPDDYGRLALLHSFIAISAIFSGLGLRQVLYIEFFHHDARQRKILINNIIIIYLLVMIPLFVLAIYKIDILNQYIFSNKVDNKELLISIGVCFSYFFSELCYLILTLQGNVSRLTVIQIIAASIMAILNFSFVYILHWGVFGMMLAYFLGTTISFIYGLYLYFMKSCAYYIEFSEARKNAKHYLKIGIPFIPSMLFGWLLSSSDRWILAHYSTLHDVGIYSLADTFGQLYQLIVMIPINGAYLPFLLKKFSENRDDILLIERWNQKNMVMLMGSMIMLVTIGCIVGKSILYIILPLKYHETIQYIWFIVMGYIFWTGTYFNLGLIFFSKKIYFHAFSLVVPCVLNAVLNITLIPLFQIYGCVMATLFSYFFYFLLTYSYNVLLQKQYAAQKYS